LSGWGTEQERERERERERENAEEEQQPDHYQTKEPHCAQAANKQPCKRDSSGEEREGRKEGRKK
jgi:hypothetical protein